MLKTIFERKGISPVIGVILLVAVTVALVALATFIVFDIGSDVNESSSSAVQTSTGSNGVQVQVLRNDNVEQFEVIGPDDKTDTLDGSVGESLNIGDGAGQYLVKAILNDGSEEVIDTITVDEGSLASEVRTGSEETTGTVSVNPEIEGATVQSIEDGFIIDETTTNENGEYTIKYSEDSELIVIVDGFEYGDNPLYASAVETDVSDTIDFEFDSSALTETTVDGEIVNVTYRLSESNTNTIATVEQLQAVNENLEDNYKLVRDIDASDTKNWNNGKGFKPIGDRSDEFGDREENEFIGILDGQGYEVDKLFINRPEESNVGLFGHINDGIVKNIGLINNDITGGSSSVGGLVGYNEGGTVSKSYTTGSVTNDGYSVGGLVGYNEGGTVSKSYTTGSVTGEGDLGGLVGYNEGDVSKSYATGTVNGTNFHVGGLVGLNQDGNVRESYATGSVTGDNDVGGLVGGNIGEVSESYATGSVTGESEVGGLVGLNGGTVSESYAIGAVNSDGNNVGGLIGQIGRDSSLGDNNHILRDSYVLEDAELTDENKVIGEIVEGDGDGDVIIKHNYKEDEIIINNSNEETEEIIGNLSNEEEIVDKLVNTFVKTETKFQGENELEQFDFTNTWSTSDEYPILQWHE